MLRLQKALEFFLQVSLSELVAHHYTQAASTVRPSAAVAVQPPCNETSAKKAEEGEEEDNHWEAVVPASRVRGARGHGCTRQPELSSST